MHDEKKKKNKKKNTVQGAIRTVILALALIGLLAARATTSGWEAWFSLLIAVILSLYATKVVKRSTRI